MINAELDQLKNNLRTVIRGKDQIIDLLLIAFCAGGNILMEDVPGVGKTTLAKALALSINGAFHRVQFTPDLLPSDILGTSIYNPRDGSFTFRRGPIFTNILLADEINRASPRTQSALLEAMNEGQVTIEGTTHPLEKPFLVIATENPIEYHGTYPLPEAQLDRFAMQLVLGYPEAEEEMEILYSRRRQDPIEELKPVISRERITTIQHEVRSIEIEQSVADYLVRIIRGTRQESSIKLGASPRAMLALSRCAQARAYLDGREFVVPDDVRTLAEGVLAHRLILDNKARFAGVSRNEIVREILSKTKVPI